MSAGTARIMGSTLAYVVAFALGLAGSALILVFAQFGSPEFVAGTAVAFAVTYAIVGGVVVWAAMRGRRWAPFLLVLPPVIVVAGGGVVVWSTMSFFRHGFETTAWRSACAAAGPTYLQRPVTPVHSITIDWDGEREPTIGEFALEGRSVPGWTRFNQLHFKERTFSFVEWKNMGYGSVPKSFPYYRSDAEHGRQIGIQGPTADVVLAVHATPAAELHKPVNSQSIVRYEVTLTDRRTATRLATLNYAIDLQWGRGCGETSAGRMNIEEFVDHAVLGS